MIQRASVKRPCGLRLKDEFFWGTNKAMNWHKDNGGSWRWPKSDLPKDCKIRSIWIYTWWNVHVLWCRKTCWTMYGPILISWFCSQAIIVLMGPMLGSNPTSADGNMWHLLVVGPCTPPTICWSFFQWLPCFWKVKQGFDKHDGKLIYVQWRYLICKCLGESVQWFFWILPHDDDWSGFGGSRYCWWKKSCTSQLVHHVSHYLQGFVHSQVEKKSPDFFHQQYLQTICHMTRLEFHRAQPPNLSMTSCLLTANPTTRGKTWKKEQLFVQLYFGDLPEIFVELLLVN